MCEEWRVQALGTLIKVKLTDLKCFISMDSDLCYLDLFPRICRLEHCGHGICASGFPEHGNYATLPEHCCLCFWDNTFILGMVNTLRSPKSLIFTVRCTIQHKAFASVLIFYLTKQTKDFSNKQNIKKWRVVQMLKQIIEGKAQSTMWKQAEFSVKPLFVKMFSAYQKLRATKVQVFIHFTEGQQLHM